MPKITFQPAGVTIDVNPGTTVFGAAAMAGVAIPSQCGGKCACALCRVTVLQGEDLVSPMTWEEEGHMGNVFYLTRERLSCQLRVFGDVVVQIADEPPKKERGRYIPYSLIRKREQMEQAEELRRVRGSGGPAPARPSGPAPGRPSEPGEPRTAGPPRPSRPEKRRKKPHQRKRNPGAPRVGDNRPPPGAKKKDPK